ncbi:MAG TPA: hypothetical protein DEA73_10220 [Peptococcaceae bacterium]|nr:hypothetical protein [Peptococcaceae bacterium]
MGVLVWSTLTLTLHYLLANKINYIIKPARMQDQFALSYPHFLQSRPAWAWKRANKLSRLAQALSLAKGLKLGPRACILAAGN